MDSRRNLCISLRTTNGSTQVELSPTQWPSELVAPISLGRRQNASMTRRRILVERSAITSFRTANRLSS
ncbi:hypothetical protein CGRA01v4_14327 [Colletotrichum graminicola]|nr:hypothetical protein CGRA01v4_14327 [Colletotrichum graminicola]